MKNFKQSPHLFTSLLNIPRTRNKTKDLIGTFLPTNRDGLVRIIRQLSGKDVEVTFVNTGYTRAINVDNLRKGKCMDETIKSRVHPTTYPNTEMQSNGCGTFTVLEKTGNKYKVVFNETGYTTEVFIENAKAGKVFDPYFKTSYGVAYLGEYKKSSYSVKAHLLWRNMLKRCYSEKDDRGYFGRGIEVHADWLCFAIFMEDIKSLPNFDKWLEGQEDKTKIQYNLDKDFAYYGCKIYSKENCQFLTESLNKATTSANLLCKSIIESYNSGGKHG